MTDGKQHETEAGQKSSLCETFYKIVADCEANLQWIPYSRDRLTAEGAQVLVKQWGIFTRHSRRCWAYVVGNCPHVEVRRFIVTENLYEEEALEGHSHFEMLLDMGGAVGLKRETVESAKPLPATLVALHAWEALTKNRTWYEGAAAKAILEMVNNPYTTFSGDQGRWWMRRLNISQDDVKFWFLHSSVDQVHGGGLVALMDEKYLETQGEREAAITAAQESMMVWGVYFDGMYQEALRAESRR